MNFLNKINYLKLKFDSKLFNNSIFKYNIRGLLFNYKQFTDKLNNSKMNTDSIDNKDNSNNTSNKQLQLENTIEETIVIVNEKDEEIGPNTRKEMRRLNLPHRSTSVFIYNSKLNKYLIQKRSNNKEYCPGYYDLVSGGVVGYKECTDKGAIREIKEEVGVDGSMDNLKFVGKIFFKNEYTTCWQYVYYIEHNGECSTSNEVDAIEFWSEDEIKEYINNKKFNITPDSIQCFNYLNENKNKN